MTDPTPEARAEARIGCPVCTGSGTVHVAPGEDIPCPECHRVARLIDEAKAEAEEKWSQCVGRNYLKGKTEGARRAERAKLYKVLEDTGYFDPEEAIDEAEQRGQLEERDRIKTLWPGLSDADFEGASARDLVAEGARAERERLRPWLGHSNDCMKFDPTDCICGLDALEIKKEETE